MKKIAFLQKNLSKTMENRVKMCYISESYEFGG